MVAIRFVCSYIARIVGGHIHVPTANKGKAQQWSTCGPDFVITMSSENSNNRNHILDQSQSDSHSLVPQSSIYNHIIMSGISTK